MKKSKDLKPIYQRVLLKLSGEALQKDRALGIDTARLDYISQEIKSIVELGVQTAVVIGGGNFIRGADLYGSTIDRVTADQMGMLATVINGLALADALDKQNMPVQVMSAIAVYGLVNLYHRRAAIDALNQGKTLIFVAGSGNPLVTTDTAAALRGIEINADIILKATKVDGVYAADPIKNPKAERYDVVTYDEMLEQRLGVMDLNAMLLCREHRLSLRVFNMNHHGALQRIMTGDSVGTLVKIAGE